MIEHHYIEQGSPQWLERRVGKYTGSNAHKLLSSMGASEYAKAIEDSFKGNFWTKRGHILEDEALELYEQIHKVKILRNESGIKVGYVTNTDYPRCLYSPDGLLTDWGVEVKCFSIKQHLELINAKSEDDINIKIRAQIHFGMLITGLKQFDLIAYNPEFAKKSNDFYDPKKAFKVILVKYNRNIANNFKRIVGKEVLVAVT